MSNNKHAYGWIGHILTKSCQISGIEKMAKDDNVIAIPEETFEKIWSDIWSGNLPACMQAESLGYTKTGNNNFIATGIGFSIAFTFYGSVFEEAELRMEKHELSHDEEAEYLSIMKSHYGIELPPCRMMIGCSSEH
jgi:hypothetical protein